MALLIQWLGQADGDPAGRTGLFVPRAGDPWMEDLLDRSGDDSRRRPRQAPAVGGQRWPLARKLLDYVEANADEYWHVPELELARGPPSPAPATEEDETRRRQAAEDGHRRAVRRGLRGRDLPRQRRRRIRRRDAPGRRRDGTDFELATEADASGRPAGLPDHSGAALENGRLGPGHGCPGGDADREPSFAGWLAQATANRSDLPSCWPRSTTTTIPAPRSNPRIAGRVRPAAGRQGAAAGADHRHVRGDGRRRPLDPRGHGASESSRPDLAAWEEPAQRVLRGRVSRRRGGIRSAWPDLIAALASQPLFYVALARGGSPQKIVASRNLQRSAAAAAGLPAPAGHCSKKPSA